MFKPLENMAVAINYFCHNAKIPNRLCLSLKSKSTCQYVTVSVMYMVCVF